ncbi:hypothetical protein FOZ62_023697 [Perkinsus olseni]|uniref:Uncharacterized protein n=1 Tax=Perkinsus olseni TaxID=32597 RepID=A0A7J6TCU1_PEROL|nr:hypothetical protein FOZ62_023697 [Perkinsus olseni]
MVLPTAATSNRSYARGRVRDSSSERGSISVVVALQHWIGPGDTLRVKDWEEEDFEDITELEGSVDVMVEMDFSETRGTLKCQGYEVVDIRPHREVITSLRGNLYYRTDDRLHLIEESMASGVVASLSCPERIDQLQISDDHLFVVSDSACVYMFDASSRSPNLKFVVAMSEEPVDSDTSLRSEQPFFRRCELQDALVRHDLVSKVLFIKGGTQGCLCLWRPGVGMVEYRRTLGVLACRFIPYTEVCAAAFIRDDQIWIYDITNEIIISSIFVEDCWRGEFFITSDWNLYRLDSSDLSSICGAGLHVIHLRHVGEADLPCDNWSLPDYIGYDMTSDHDSGSYYPSYNSESQTEEDSESGSDGSSPGYSPPKPVRSYDGVYLGPHYGSYHDDDDHVEYDPEYIAGCGGVLTDDPWDYGGFDIGSSDGGDSDWSDCSFGSCDS